MAATFQGEKAMAIFCSGCGTSMEEGVKFCPSCGKASGVAATSPMAGAPVPPPSSGGGAMKIILIVVGIIGLIGILAIGSCFYIGYKFKKAAGDFASNSKPYTGKKEPCSFVNVDEATEALGTPVQTAVAHGSTVCDYALGTDGNQHMMVSFMWKGGKGTFTELPGVGDEAFVAPGDASIMLRKGDVMVNIDLHSAGLNAEGGKKVAALIAGRLSVRISKGLRGTLIVVLTIVFLATLAAQAADSRLLHAGAARVDITPSANALPVPYTSVRDHLFVRAIVLENGVARAALVGVDLIGIDEPLWQEISKQVAQELQCPVDNIIISATHSHSSPYPEDGKSPPDPNYAAFRAKLKEGILGAVRDAKGKLQPARMGFGTGSSYLNVNRDAVHPETRLWYQGPNLEGPSDKTVGVLKFESLSGEPIAAYVNYAIHAIDYYEMGILTADFPGVTSRFVERAYDDKMVAIWSSGAAGDENPLYLRQQHDARDAKFGFDKNPNAAAKVALDRAVGELNDWVDSMGRAMAEEVVRVMDAGKIDPTKQTSSEVRIWGGGKTVTCPGRTSTNN